MFFRARGTIPLARPQFNCRRFINFLPSKPPLVKAPNPVWRCPLKGSRRRWPSGKTASVASFCPLFNGSARSFAGCFVAVLPKNHLDEMVTNRWKSFHSEATDPTSFDWEMTMKRHGFWSELFLQDQHVRPQRQLLQRTKKVFVWVFPDSTYLFFVCCVPSPIVF